MKNIIKNIPLLIIPIDKITELKQKIPLVNLESLIRLVDASALVSVADVDGRILYVNYKFKNTSQYSDNELVGRDHRVVNSGYHSDSFWGEMYATTVEGRGVWDRTVKNKRKDGSYYWVSTYIMACFDEEDNHIGWISLRQDITDLIEGKQKIISTNKEIKNAMQELAVKNSILAQENTEINEFKLQQQKISQTTKVKMHTLIVVALFDLVLLLTMIHTTPTESVIAIVSSVLSAITTGVLLSVFKEPNNNTSENKVE